MLNSLALTAIDGGPIQLSVATAANSVLGEV
jgi:hypothetical protein